MQSIVKLLIRKGVCTDVRREIHNFFSALLCLVCTSVLISSQHLLPLMDGLRSLHYVIRYTYRSKVSFFFSPNKQIYPCGTAKGESMKCTNEPPVQFDIHYGRHQYRSFFFYYYKYIQQSANDDSTNEKKTRLVST